MAVPVLLILLIHQGLHQWGLDISDSSRLMNVMNTEISLVDRSGAIHEGILTETTRDTVTMTVGSDTKTFTYDDVVRAERIRDRHSDGAAKGAIVGFVVALVATQFTDSWWKRQAHWVGWTGIGAGVGWMLDAGQDHRETIYESWTMPAAAVKVKLPF